MGLLRGYGAGDVTNIGTWLILERDFESGIFLRNGGPWKFALSDRLGAMGFLPAACLRSIRMPPGRT